MVIGTAASLLILFAFFFQNWKRARISEVTELKPNCLLTSSPLVFISGKRSLFYFLAYWNEIPHWLASHGYDVFSLPLPWRKTERRKQAMRIFLSEKSLEGMKFHLFLDSSSLGEVAEILEEKDYSCLASVTLIGRGLEKTLCFTPRQRIAIEEIELPETVQARAPIFWLLHQAWTLQPGGLALSQLGWKLSRLQGDFLLERVQFLAERDLLQNQRSPTLKA